MLVQKIYLTIGLVLAVAFLISSGVGKVKTRSDGSLFSTAVLIFILWPICIIFALYTLNDPVKFEQKHVPQPVMIIRVLDRAYGLGVLA